MVVEAVMMAVVVRLPLILLEVLVVRVILYRGVGAPDWSG